MNITLRKANSIQNSISEAIKNIEIKTTIDINEFQDHEQELRKANDEIFLADARRQKLLLALYNIRGLVSAANSQNGIDLNLTKAAFIEKRIIQIEEVSRSKSMTDLAIIKGKLDKIRGRPDDGKSAIYGREDSVTTSVLSQEQIQKAKEEINGLKKQKQEINDEILEANIRTEIPLSEDVANTLRSEGII